MEQRTHKPVTVQDLLARQDRTISRRQVLAADKTARWWDWKVTHDWQRVGEGVAIAHLGTPDPAQLEWPPSCTAAPALRSRGTWLWRTSASSG
jgi:hypothetical protein